MKNPSKKKYPVKVGAKNAKAGKFLPKAPLKDGMATPKTDAKMSKIKPGDAKPSYVGTKDSPGSASAGKMKATGLNAKMRKKTIKR